VRNEKCEREERRASGKKAGFLGENSVSSTYIELSLNYTKTENQHYN
jgi:hypothetical protein